MPFRPNGNDIIQISSVPYRFVEHPAAPGMPYGQEGRAATVYAIANADGRRALKVFKSHFRVPALVGVAKKLAPYADLPGLEVCRRIVLVPQQHSAMLREHPDLLYAVIMPWVEGPTWMEVLIEKRDLPMAQCLTLAAGLADVLARMEQSGLAHCDISGANILIPALAGPGAGAPITLVDVEQMFGPGFERPEYVPGGSFGYAHSTAPQGLWEILADRFAGAIVIAEMLGWCDPEVREAAWGESYFEPHEMQQPGKRYDIMLRVLTTRWGRGVAGLFEQAWYSATLEACPSFDEWVLALPDTVPQSASAALPQAQGVVSGSTDLIEQLKGEAQELLAAGNSSEALAIYREALSLAPQGSPVAAELGVVIQGLSAGASHSAPLTEPTPLPDVPPPVSTPRPEPPRELPPSFVSAPPPTLPTNTNPRPVGVASPAKKRLPFIIAGGVALLVLVGAVVLFLATSKAGTSAANDPTPTVPGVAAVLPTETALLATDTPQPTEQPTTERPTEVEAVAVPSDTPLVETPTVEPSPTLPEPAYTPDVKVCFNGDQTCISGTFLTLWNHLGGQDRGAPGLAGLPLGNASMVNGVLTQPFERYTMEERPEVSPFGVQLADLGVERYAAVPQHDPPQKAVDGCRFFPQTNYNVCEIFYQYWLGKGDELGLTGQGDEVPMFLFGAPISGVRTEKIGGNEYRVQWFQKARFELHSEDPANPHVELSLLGTGVPK